MNTKNKSEDKDDIMMCGVFAFLALYALILAKVLMWMFNYNK